jgi:hypothetical protein
VHLPNWRTWRASREPWIAAASEHLFPLPQRPIPVNRREGQVPAETANSKLISSGSFEKRDVVTSHAADAESDGNELPTLTSYVI